MSKNKYNIITNEQCSQAVIFARVSSEEQSKGASIDAQLQSVKDYCSAHGFKILKQFDIVESSTRGGRKLFYEMLDFVKSQKHKIAIVVNCVDRLQRGYKECVELDELRKQGRIELHFYKEGFYLHKDSISTDILRWDMGVLSAKMYVGSLRDNVIRSMDYKREHGQWQSCAPIGYLNIPKTKNTPADIIIDPDRGPKVKRLFEEYAKGGRTLQDITNLARSMNLYSKMSTVKKTISRSQIQCILKNPFYIGYMINKGKKYKHNYEHLIDAELFKIVQETMIGRKRSPNKQFYGEKQYIFTGLIHCGCCGSLMTCETHTKKNGKEYVYLKCNKLRNKCSQKPISENAILNQLKEELDLQLNLNDEEIEALKKEVRNYIKNENINTSVLKKGVTEKLQQLKDKENRLFDFYLDGKCDETTYTNKKSEIEEEREKLQKDMDKFLTIDANTDKTLENIAEITANFGKFLESSIISKKHDILNIILSNSKTDGKKLVYSITKPFDKLLKSPKTEEWCRWPESRHLTKNLRFSAIFPI